MIALKSERSLKLAASRAAREERARQRVEQMWPTQCSATDLQQRRRSVVRELAAITYPPVLAPGLVQ